MKNEFTHEELANIVSILHSEVGEFPTLAVFENNKEFFEVIFKDKAYEAVRAVKLGYYVLGDEWVGFDEYDNLVTYTTEQYMELLTNYAEDIVAIGREFIDKIDAITFIFEE